MLIPAIVVGITCLLELGVLALCRSHIVSPKHDPCFELLLLWLRIFPTHDCHKLSNSNLLTWCSSSSLKLSTGNDIVIVPGGLVTSNLLKIFWTFGCRGMGEFMNPGIYITRKPTFPMGSETWVATKVRDASFTKANENFMLRRWGQGIDLETRRVSPTIRRNRWFRNPARGTCCIWNPTKNGEKWDLLNLKCLMRIGPHE